MFGLTGGVASGKSTVGARFRERGLEVIDADQVARDVVAPKSDGLKAVIDAFGDNMLTSEGTLDRAAMRELVFAEPEARRRLNAIVHPRIAAETMARTRALDDAGVQLACYEAPLLVENGLADGFRPLVVVSLDPALQHARLMQRDGMTAEGAARLIAAQLPLSDKVALADYVIDNGGSRAALLERADAVLNEIRDALSQRRGG